MTTKKLFLSVLAAFLCLATASARDNSFGKGNLGINLDYGIGTFDIDDFGYDDDDFGWHGNVAQSSLGAVIEYGILDGLIKGKGTVTVGGQLGFGFGSKHNVDYTRVRIATRGAFHYQFIPQLGTYAGITCGIVDINKAKAGEGSEKITDTHTRVISPRPFGGIRFMLTDGFGLHSEVSWDNFALWSFGVTFKF
ncbi:MAG: hypothetical protein J6Y82_05135 [Bacteroidales bacterium]|nr:hypothetical protein [Bacteroidales bacterium]